MSETPTRPAPQLTRPSPPSRRPIPASPSSAGFTSGEPPVVCQYERRQNLFQFSGLGEVEATGDLYTDLESRFIPGTAAAIAKDGHYYGVPWSIHTDTQIFHNETVLEANGIDPAALVTWDDYQAAFITLKDAAITPVAFANKFGWSGSRWFYAFLVRQVGADAVLDLCAKLGDGQWTDPGFVQAAQHYVDLNANGFFSAGAASDDYPSATALFFAGRSGFFQTGSWLLGSVEAEAPPDFRIGLNTFPTVPGGEGDPRQHRHAGHRRLLAFEEGLRRPGQAGGRAHVPHLPHRTAAGPGVDVRDPGDDVGAGLGHA